MRFFWLNFHLDYACKHSGACCSAGWPIPVQSDRASQLQQITSRADWLLRGTEASDDVAGTLAVEPDGRCVFHGDRGCGVYAARPSSCAHFPYLCLIDHRGVHVTLSHYCPTAASMLFGHQGPIEIVEGPPPPTGLAIPEGLDARESLPPLASPNRLMSFDEFAAWEAYAVGTVGAHMALDVAWPEAPHSLGDVCRRLVAPAWPAFAPVITRYLAAKAFASWAAYLDDDGTAAVLKGVDAARAALQVEAARQCARAERMLDAQLLKAAIRQSDLLLVHSTDTQVSSSASQT